MAWLKTETGETGKQQGDKSWGVNPQNLLNK